MTIKVLNVFGTRPEAIKMAPVCAALQSDNRFTSKICVTGQHREMLDSVMDFFRLKSDFDLDVMRPGHSLNSLSSAILTGLNNIFSNYRPDCVLVHGDTTTCFVASLASFHENIPIGHVEAGLRTGDINSPWPEEANRKLTASLARLHFSPTKKSKENLEKELVHSSKIVVTGNTVVDSLFFVSAKLAGSGQLTEFYEKKFKNLDKNKRIVLVTGHRRESFGDGFRNICASIKQIANNNDVEIVYPVHLNPQVKGPVETELSGLENVHLIEPQDYLSFIYLMNRAYLVLTDSGGVQEEAPSLGKPVLVMRNNTERPEAVDAGTVKLVGTDEEKIISATEHLLYDNDAYLKMSHAHNPYGDGQAASRIVSRLADEFSTKVVR